MDEQSLFQHDIEQTILNREKLRKNKNLIYWYENLYKDLFRNEKKITDKVVLEVGSGTSPLKLFIPTAISSDVMSLDYLDFVFDCHEIANFSEICDHSIDVMVLTNVLHHLRDPLLFLKGAAQKLKNGGSIYILEPYFSILSTPIYKFLHHEPVNFKIDAPKLDNIEGPLSTSNQAMPFMIFFKRSEWLNELSYKYDLEKSTYGFYTGISYMLSGGISRRIPLDARLYKAFFFVDRFLAKVFPKIFSSFFKVRLISK